MSWLNRGHFDLDDGAQICGKAGAEFSGQHLMHHLDGAYLVGGDAFRPFEVVNLDVFRQLRLGRGRAQIGGRGDVDAGIHGIQKRVDLALRQYVRHSLSNGQLIMDNG